MSSPSEYTLVLTDPARDDLEAIANYTALQWGEEQAITYREALYQTLLSIADNPDAGRPRYGVPETFKGRTSGKHVIFYRVEEKTVYISAHPACQHGSWQASVVALRKNTCGSRMNR